VGAYSLNNNPYDIAIMVAAGLAGIVFRVYGFDPAPLVLSMVIAPMMEMAFRQGLIASRGNIWTF
jgi:putative tricarboxylic transport membrane protein